MTGVQTCALPICFPVTIIDAIIPKVDKKDKIVHSILPDGLLEVYTQEDAD